MDKLFTLSFSQIKRRVNWLYIESSYLLHDIFMLIIFTNEH